MSLNKGDKVAIVGCSNAQQLKYKHKIEELLACVKTMGLEPVLSDCIYEKYSVFSGEGEDRAKALMKFYLDKEVKAIFDISGGDVANEVLEYLDYALIEKNYKPFFGYSDLTTVINAIYSKINKPSYLYQIRNLIYENGKEQIRNFTAALFEASSALTDINYEFLQGSAMEGIVIGGNIRCLLKLAGTSYMPSFEDKILFLEAFSGEVAAMTTYLNQYRQLGAFKKLKGILLGTFTEMDKSKASPTIEELVLKIVGDKNMPIARTYEIGHGTASKALIIGEYRKF